MAGPKSSGRRATVATLIGVALLALVLIWIAQAISAYNQVQNCIDSGRRDCVPVPGGSNG